jgi:8-amino-7-oxononanoate synthase
MSDLPNRPRIDNSAPRIFEKCRHFVAARRAMADGVYPFFLPIQETSGPEVMIGGRRTLMLGSNNYLGLTHHPRVLDAAASAIRRYGAGCTGSRFMNGNTELHERLEERLARFMRKESALVFSTGYQTNLGVISALVGLGDRVYIDSLDHASIFDASRLSGGRAVVFGHGDFGALRRLMEEGRREDEGGLLVVDGVYSMDGEIADLPTLARLAKDFGVPLVVDDAHSIGVLGPTGAGTAEHYGLSDEVDLVIGTFSKSFASIGGFVAGTESVIHYIRHHARSEIFSAALPAANVAAVLAALDVIESEPERRRRLWDVTRRMAEALEHLGFDTGASQTPIIPIILSDMDAMLLFWKRLLDEGVYVNAVMPPAVPADGARLRTSYMATHTDSQLEFALQKFEKVGKELRII